jgi:ABC-type spermidine/putrescine transport system permease subunit II
MKRRGKISKAIHRIYIALIMLFLYSPIAVLILFSFNAGESRGNNECSVYGIIPKEIAEMKKTCNKFEDQ